MAIGESSLAALAAGRPRKVPVACAPNNVAASRCIAGLYAMTLIHRVEKEPLSVCVGDGSNGERARLVLGGQVAEGLQEAPLFSGRGDGGGSRPYRLPQWRAERLLSCRCRGRAQRCPSV